MLIESSFARAITVRNAFFLADATAKSLAEKYPKTLTGEIRWSAAFFIEFGAVVQIGYWERQGIDAHLAAGLPSYKEATRKFLERCRQGPTTFEDVGNTPLCDEVFSFWIGNIAWSAPTTMEAEVALGEVDEDRFLDLLADFLWNHRNELGDILDDPSDEEVNGDN